MPLFGSYKDRFKAEQEANKAASRSRNAWNAMRRPQSSGGGCMLALVMVSTIVVGLALTIAELI